MIELSDKLPPDPNNVYWYLGPAFANFFLDRFSEAEGALERASERKLDNPFSLVIRYNLAVLNNDRNQMDLITAQARGRKRAEHGIAHAEALALARSGRLQAARQSSNRAVDLALRESEGGREEATNYVAARGVWEAFCGHAAEGKKSAAGALELSNGRDVQYAAGLALAIAGDFSRSEKLAGELERRHPEDTFAKFIYAPVLRAFAALGRDKAAESVERLEIARRYELAVNGLNYNHYYLGGLHSAYVRGEALTAAHRYADAAAEY